MRVSVILPFYNARETLEQAISGVLNDGCEDLELVLVDDGSTDQPDSIIARYSSDKRVIVLRQANHGLASALNSGIACSSGAFVARMDADDICISGRFDAQREFLLTHPEAVLVGGQIHRLVGGGVSSVSTFPTTHDEIVDGLRRGEHVLCHPAVMFRRNAFETVGGYWSHGVAEDWDLFLRFSSVGQLRNLDDRVIMYRYHDGGINANSMRCVRRNIRLAVRNAVRREAGMSELDPSEFDAATSLFGRIGISMETASLTMYRRALRRIASSSHASLGRMQMLAAGLIYPPFALRRIRREVANRVSDARSRAPDFWPSES